MYKNRAASFQRRYKVHEIDFEPKGYVEDDFIPSAANMGLDEVEDERRKLMFEKTRLEQDLVVAKQGKDQKSIALIGGQIQTLCCRLSLLRKRRTELNNQRALDVFKRAAEEVLTAEQFAAVKRRCGEINAEEGP